MNMSALLLLAMMGTVCSFPICPDGCELTDRHHQQSFIHMSELQHSSVAPWNLTVNVAEGREPHFIEHAVCKDCTVEHMIAKPIYLQIKVYQRISSGADSAWCKCPYELAVGCTCVREQQQ